MAIQKGNAHSGAPELWLSKLGGDISIRWVVYDRNHLFGLGPIPKPKLKIWPKLLADTETNRNHKILCWRTLYQGACKKFSCQVPKHLFGILLISIMSINYKIVGNHFK